MQTTWAGLALPGFASNVAFTQVYFGRTRRYVLPDVAHVPMTVHLPATTTQIELWTVDAEIWVALDEMLGSIPPPLQQTVADAGTLSVGQVILPNYIQVIAVPPDGAHWIQLLSATASPSVLVTCLIQMP
jgi:hypothetical protein